jgi:hypothetical protein
VVGGKYVNDSLSGVLSSAALTAGPRMFNLTRVSVSFSIEFKACSRQFSGLFNASPLYLLNDIDSFVYFSLLFVCLFVVSL